MKTIFAWMKLVSIPRLSLSWLFVFLVIDAAFHVVLPLSFAKIVTSATAQNFSLTTLWAAINFMMQLLALAIERISSTKIAILSEHIKHNLSNSFNTDNSTQLSYFLNDLYKSAKFVMRALSILISSAFIALNLSLFLFGAIIVCTAVGYIEKLHKQKNHISIQSSYTWGNILWIVFTYSIITFAIYELRMQTIKLTVFLFLLSFISTHLLRPNFSEFFAPHIKSIRMLLEK